MTGRSASSGTCSSQLDAVGARQHQVQQDQLGPVCLEEVGELPRVARHERDEAGCGERVPHVAQRLRVVVDHEDARLLSGFVRRAGAARGDGGRTRWASSTTGIVRLSASRGPRRRSRPGCGLR